MNVVVCKNVELHEVRGSASKLCFQKQTLFRKFSNVKIECELLTLGPQWICGLGQHQEYPNWSFAFKVILN